MIKVPQPPLDYWQYRIRIASSNGIDVGGGFKVEIGPELPIAKVQDNVGSTLGYLLGFPIDLNRKGLVKGKWRAPDCNAADSIVRALGGRFLYIEKRPGGPRIYPDALAQIPCVYDAEARVAGCSAHALFDDEDYEARLDRSLVKAAGVIGEGWLPAMLTAHTSLARLYPGHVLNLADGAVTRVWQGKEVDCSIDDLVDEFIELSRMQFQALAAGDHRIALALTAGRDSRSVLSMAREIIDTVDCVTVVAGDRHATDSVVARRITREQKIRYLELPRRTATKAEQALYLRRNGHCNGDSNRLYHPSVWPLVGSHVFVGGVGGEIGRGDIWKPSDNAETKVCGEEVIARFGLPKVPRIVAAMDDRLSRMPEVDGLRCLDLLYIEDRCAAWSSAQFPGDPTLVRYAPLATIRGLELMLAQPTEWKRTGRLSQEIVRRTWPELLQYPINTLGRAMDSWISLRRAIREPHLVLKKLRKLRA